MLVAYVSRKARQVQAPTKVGRVLNSVLPRLDVFSSPGVYAWVDKRLPTESPINGASIHDIHLIEPHHIQTLPEGSSGQRTQFRSKLSRVPTR